ncbi:hypothetical protein WOC76_23550 [Methylocystis sp. IM3]|jgi:hypothetical protein
MFLHATEGADMALGRIRRLWARATLFLAANSRLVRLALWLSRAMGGPGR